MSVFVDNGSFQFSGYPKPAFDAGIGVKKPGPRIYHLTTNQLGIKPQEGLYIGDGSSQELTGASQIGMQAVLLRLPDEEGADVHRIDREE